MALVGNVPRWLQVSTLVLAVAGLAVSAYLTYEHFTASTTLACPDTGAINCVKVTTSSYSTVVGFPVALLGLFFFLAVSPLMLPTAWRATQPWLSRVRLLAVTLGVLFVLYLVWAELFRIDAICLWCTAVHGLTLALFACVLLGEAARAPTPSDHAGPNHAE